MKTLETINTKQVRQDLVGFLRRLRQGHTIRVVYRSKPLVTLAAQEEIDPYLAADAGTPVALKRSVRFVRSLLSRRLRLILLKVLKSSTKKPKSYEFHNCIS